MKLASPCVRLKRMSAVRGFTFQLRKSLTKSGAKFNHRFRLYVEAYCMNHSPQQHVHVKLQLIKNENQILRLHLPAVASARADLLIFVSYSD